jgi:uncharacterized protein YyaL (SSP411 family)
MSHARHPAGRTPNALAGETSPYLLQHAFNPVAWRPWGEAAIREARERDRPLFVSIGYSTCHWCHVMERESFESEATAELLNRDFVPVKVDREERPDVDEVYMTACQAFTRLTEGRASGGWPLSAWVDPHSLKPFWVGTYFPPVAMHGRPSFDHMLERLAAAWQERREEVNAQAARIGEAIRLELELELEAPGSEAPAAFGPLAERAAAALVGYADFTHGGFGGAPKFPQPPFLSLVGRFGGEPGVKVLDAALDAMVLGGIHDQVGGGFHRYAVDASWTVPHFEKMLYDQALLLPFLARRAAAGDALHRHACERLVAFLDRELTEPDGAFRSALDAEAEGREGDPYAWTDEAFAAAFAASDAAMREEAERLYGLALGPNFRDPHHEDSPPMRVLRIERRPDGDGAALVRRDRFDAALLAARASRPQPSVDDKVIAAWNGLMVAGLAEAGKTLGRRDWIARAEGALAATIARLGPIERLKRTARGGVTAPIPAQLEDVGALALAAATLADATGDARYATLARTLVDLADRDFAAPGGGWFDAPLDLGPAALFVRSRSLSDGAVPAGNTLVVAAIVRLLRRAPDAELAARLARAARAFAPAIAANPTGSALLLAELAAAEAEGLLPAADADPCADGECRV